MIIYIDPATKLAPTFAGDYTVHPEDGTKLRLGRRYEKRLHEIMRIAI